MVDMTPRPMKCKRCGRIIISTVAARTRGCGKGKLRKDHPEYDKDKICYGKMHEITMDEYLDWKEAKI